MFDSRFFDSRFEGLAAWTNLVLMMKIRPCYRAFSSVEGLAAPRLTRNKPDEMPTLQEEAGRGEHKEQG